MPSTTETQHANPSTKSTGEPAKLRFNQIAAAQPNDDAVLYALDGEGRIWALAETVQDEGLRWFRVTDLAAQ